MAGILDLLNGGGAPGGGLLDFLRNNALNQQMPGGLPSDTANYGQPQPPMSMAGPTPAMPGPIVSANQPSPLDNAQWPAGPVGAPSDANASMPRLNAAPMSFAPAQPPAVIPAAPAAAADTSPGLGDRFALGAKGFLGNMALGPIGAIAGGLGALVAGKPTDPATIEAQKLAKSQSATTQALIAKGADPVSVQAAMQSPELMKSLITQFYGPQTVTSLGQGYVADKNGNVRRAYEPEDKTPIGFEKLDNGTMRPIPGGPADPSYLRSKTAGETDPNAVKVLGRGGELYKLDKDGNPVIVHKNDQGEAEATLDDHTTRAMAAQYLSGDRTVMQNLGRGAQGAANIVKLRTEIYKQAEGAGLNPKDIVTTFNEQAGNLAGQRAVGTRAANIALAANEASNMIPIALEASAKVPRGDWMPWNKAVQSYQKGTSSPELASFVAATNSLVNAYVRAVSPSGVPTDSMREHAYSMLNSAQGPDAYAAVVSTMQKEMNAALQAPEQVRKELRGESTAGGGLNAPAVPKAGNYVWTPGGGLVGAK